MTPLPAVERAAQRIQKELDTVKAKYRTEHDNHEPYWLGVRIGLETALNILTDKKSPKVAELSTTIAPVAWAIEFCGELSDLCRTKEEAEHLEAYRDNKYKDGDMRKVVPLYSHPPLGAEQAAREAVSHDWVPCSERMPENHTQALVYNPDAECDLVTIGVCDGRWWHTEEGDWSLGCITHWMPLPKSPREK